MSEQSNSKNNLEMPEELKNPSILDVDLIKDEVAVKFQWRKHLLIMLIFVVLAGSLVAEAYFLLLGWEQQEVTRKSENFALEVQKIDKKISNLKTQLAPALALKSKVDVINPILTKHVYWTNFFGFLEKNTLVNVYYNGFTGTTDGNYVLKALVNDFRAVSYQLKTILKDPTIKSATIANEQIDNQKNGQVNVYFDLSIGVKPDLFNQ
jgi:hypothetical protein